MSVQKTPAGSWEVRFRVHGQQKQKTFLNYRAAVSFDEKTETQLRDGDYVPPSDVTVAEIIDKCLKRRSGKKGRWKEQTYLSHKGYAENYILPALGHMKATSARAIDVETAAAQWKDLSAKSVNKVLGDLTVAFEFARKKFGVKSNPMIDVERAVNQETLEEIEAEALGSRTGQGR